MGKSVFATNLVRARKIKRWSQQGAVDSVKAAGARRFTRAMLASYETGRTEPSHKVLQAICEAYGVDDIRGFLLDADFFESRTSAEELHRRYQALSGAARKAVDALLGIGP